MRLANLHPPLLAIGACSLIWQVASARSILAGLHGNELTLGLVLGSWLLLTGLAAALSLRAASRWLAPVLLLLPLGILTSLVLQQQTLPAFTAVGQVVGPGRALLSALLCLLPACAPLGLAFGLVTLLRPEGASTARWAARLFVLESLGTVAAGLLFHVWLAYASLAAAALACGGACWLAAGPVLGLTRRRVWLPAAVVGAGALLYLGAGPLLDLPGLRPTTPGYELLEQRSSPHAALSVARRGDQVLFFANGVLLHTNQDHRRAEIDVHLALLAHPAPRRVLMIGGGLGGGLAEVLEHPVERVDYVELDPVLVELARRRGGPDLARTLADRRVRLLLGDGRAELRGGERYDVVLVGVPGPSSALLNRYYTVEFFREASRALRPGGLLRVVLAGKESLALPDRMARVHASVRAAMREVFGHVKVLPGGRTFLLAAQRPLKLTFVALAQRLRARQLETRFLGETELMDRTLELKHEHYLEQLEKTRPLANTDLHPAVYFREALSWLAPTSPAFSRGLERAADGVQAHRWVPAAAVLLLGLFWGLVRRRAGAGHAPAGLAMAAAGLSGLAVELSLLLAAQTARGVVYHEIGALLTAFMAGLAAGAPAGRWLVARAPRRALQMSVGAVALTSVAAAGTTVLALRYPTVALPLLLAQMLLLGGTVGATYPAASEALARGARSEGARAGPGGEAKGVPRAAQPVAAGARSRAPGRAYAWDLAGAALGALIAAGVALPVLGLPGTCLTCGALCLGVALTARA